MDCEQCRFFNWHPDPGEPPICQLRHEMSLSRQGYERRTTAHCEDWEPFRREPIHSVTLADYSRHL